MIRPRIRYRPDDQPYVDAWHRRAGEVGWLSYHLHRLAPSNFGLCLLRAVKDIDRALPHVGLHFIQALASVRYVPVDQDAAAWRAGFEQLLQMLAEIMVIRALCKSAWPESRALEYEPINTTTGRRPEMSIELDDRILLIEVKCPALIDHQYRRADADYHLPARGVAGELLRGQAEPNRLALPRDNVVKDFLVSAEEKFRGFSQGKPTSGVLVVVWDGHLYEPISSLRHPEAGLFTANSFARDLDGNRLQFSSVEGVIVMEGLGRLGAAAQETEPVGANDSFVVDPLGMPSAWCPNQQGSVLHAQVAEALATHPIDDLAHIAEYRPQDVIFWFDPAAR